MTEERKSSRMRIGVGGPECRCSSCHRWLPATREYFYMQRRGGVLQPHCWCKPCYASNNGRASGMRVATPAAHVERCTAAAEFVRLRCGAGEGFIGARIEP